MTIPSNPLHIIVGDLILDRFVYGETNRIAAEAPILVLDVTSEEEVLGGAYNVAANLCSLGHMCLFLSVVGADFRTIEDNPYIGFHALCQTKLYSEQRLTSKKTRLIANYKRSYLLRVDREERIPIERASEDKIISDVKSCIFSVESLIIVDYKKGVITERLSKELISIAKKHSVPVFVDTKSDRLDQFKGAFLIKPNSYEFEKIRLRYAPNQSFESACRSTLQQIDLACLVITQGDSGMSLFTDAHGLEEFPAVPVDNPELSGAGDCALAAIIYCLASGKELREACIKANFAAGRMVAKGPRYRLLPSDLET